MVDQYDDVDELDDADLEAEDAELDEPGNGFVQAEGSGADPAEALQALVAYVAAQLVDRPEEVEVRASQHGQHVQLSLIVPEDELGKVIGRQGRIARAIRTVVMVAGSRHNVRASLDIEG